MPITIPLPCLTGIAIAMACVPAAANERVIEDNKGVLNLVLENDLFAGTDQGYTNGIRLAWLSSENNVPEWAQWSASNFLPSGRDGNKRLSIAVGQSMYAPQNLSQTTPIEDDQPYAGWLYASLGLVADTGKVLDNAVLTLGVVGPLAYAEQTQKFVHKVVGSPDPKGWDNQLDNELGINFAYERKWRGIYEASPFGVGTDIMPHVGVNLGNVNSSASLGATMRLGYDLPADYGPPRIRPSLPGSDFFIPTQQAGGYLFAAVEGRAVARNIFLDGNTFHDSLDVDKKALVSSLQLGAALTYGAARISYTHVFMTREFDTQDNAPQFGALTLSYRF